MYICKRFIDRLRPGDKVPDGAYLDNHLAAMLALGTIELDPTAISEKEPAPVKAKPTPATKK